MSKRKKPLWYSLFACASGKNLTNWIPDKIYLQIMYRGILGKKLNLKEPKTLNEKLQWIKIYDHRDIYTTLVDKAAAKSYVSEIIGDKYIIPTYGVWDSVDEVDFDNLPDAFVIKCTHDSGAVCICRNKGKEDIVKIKRTLRQSMKRNFFYHGREWPYKNVKPRIIAEELIGTSEGSYSENIDDYKIQCFNGKVDSIFVCVGRHSIKGVRYHYFDKDWNYLPYCPYDDVNYDELVNLKPEKLSEMIEIAEKLSQGFPHMRVDLYYVGGRIYFGEMTLFTQSGFDDMITEEADLIMGTKVRLPIK